MHDIAVQKLEPHKVYTYQEIKKIISPGQSTTAEYILGDLIAAGRVVQVPHPVLDVRGYKVTQ